MQTQNEVGVITTRVNFFTLHVKYVNCDRCDQQLSEVLVPACCLFETKTTTTKKKKHKLNMLVPMLFLLLKIVDRGEAEF